MIFAHQGQLALLWKFLAQRRFHGIKLGGFPPGIVPVGFHSFVQPFGQKVVQPLKKVGQAELVLKIVNQVCRLKFLITGPLERETEPVTAAELRRAHNGHVKAAIAAERRFFC